MKIVKVSGMIIAALILALGGMASEAAIDGRGVEVSRFKKGHKAGPIAVPAPKSEARRGHGHHKVTEVTG